MGSTGNGAALGRFQRMEFSSINNFGCVIIAHGWNILI
jgi:hypothetical protein